MSNTDKVGEVEENEKLFHQKNDFPFQKELGETIICCKSIQKRNIPLSYIRIYNQWKK